MSISAAATASAFRLVQDDGGGPQEVGGRVVIGLQSNADPAAPEGAPGTSAPSKITELLDRLTTWIPSESIATFFTFASLGDVYDHLERELALGSVVLILTAGYAYRASLGAQAAHHRRKQKSRAVTTAALAMLSFLIWWAATPGTWLTDNAGVNSFYVGLGLLLVTVFMPWLAKRLRVEPLRA